MFHKIIQVFTKEYREETAYRELAEDRIDMIRLKTPNKDIDKIGRLRDEHFHSKFKITVGMKSF